MAIAEQLLGLGLGDPTSGADVPVIEMARISRTTTIPISYLVFVACADCFEADYLIGQ